jgi:D-alanine-D-alanine ligase
LDRIDWHGKKVGVLLGGLSSERAVSLNSGKAVATALRDRGYDVVEIDVGRDLAAMLAKENIEVAFNALHGKYGEDGAVAGVLEVMGVPYTGSGILGSSLAMDKVASKMVFSARNIPTPFFSIGTRGEEIRVPSFGLPAVVKPKSEGSSVGITIVRDEEQLQTALGLAFNYDDRVLIEKYVDGSEIQVGILDDEAIGDVEIVPGEEFYNYKAKYEADAERPTQYFVPARIDDSLRKECHRVALDAYRALECSSYARVDLLVDREQRIYALEVNTLPGLTATSLLPKIAKHAGLVFEELVERILSSATLGIKSTES